jgi:hypothetical protein
MLKIYNYSYFLFVCFAAFAVSLIAFLLAVSLFFAARVVIYFIFLLFLSFLFAISFVRVSINNFNFTVFFDRFFSPAEQSFYII